jgi:ATP-binding cassette, subfamily C, bacterial
MQSQSDKDPDQRQEASDDSALDHAETHDSANETARMPRAAELEISTDDGKVIEGVATRIDEVEQETSQKPQDAPMARNAAIPDVPPAISALATKAANDQGLKEADAGEGGGRKPRKPIMQRTHDREFRAALSTGLASVKRNIIIVALFSLVINTLVLSLPIYLFQISDRVLVSRSMDTLVMLSIVVIGALLAHVVLDVIRRFILTRVAVDFEARLGAPLLSAAAKASQAGSSKEFQILSDLQQIRSFLTGPVLLTMLDAPVAPIYLLAVFLINPTLGFIVLVSAVILFILALINQKLTAVSFARAATFGSRANLQADAMARNAQVMNAMGMVPEGVAMWGRETAESLRAQVVAQDRNTIMTGLSKFVRLMTQICMLGWGAYLSLDNHITGGMTIAASVIAGRALAPLEGIIEGWRGFIHAKGANIRIRSLLQSSALNFERLRLPQPKGKLTIERLLYVPPPTKKVILNGISFELNPGESLAIVGPSGTGKSTLARMLVGSIIPTAGSIRLDMMDLRNWDPRQFGENIGYLPQDVQLFPGTIKSNIARMREDATDEEIFEAAELADIHEMIAGFAQGYETAVQMDGSPLSGGQRQRIGLARAFYGDPKLVVLDEPNSNLDTIGEQALAKALMRAKQRKITVVAITQRPALLRSVDKILMLKDGSVQALGPRDEVMPILTGQRPMPQPGAIRQPPPPPSLEDGALAEASA